MSKPSLGSLNLPELPDFSRSPLTSIPLWLGLGGMAALILAFPFLSSQFKGVNSVAKKPATPTTQVATTPTDIPTPYQPTDPIVTNGVGTPSPSVSSPSSVAFSGIPSPGGLNPQPGNLSGQTPNLTSRGSRTSIPPNILNGQNSSATLNPNNRYPFNNVDKQTGLPGQSGSNNSAIEKAIAAAKAQQNQIASSSANKPKKGSSDAGVAALPSQPQSNIENITDLNDPRLKLPSNETSGKKVSQPRPRISQRPLAQNPESNNESSGNTLVGQGTELNTNGSGLFSSPIAPPKVDSNPNLETPVTSPAESVQAKGLQGYFQGRWRADPNFDGSLQYRVNVGKNGKVISLEGADERSRIYLDKTNFLKPGEAVSKSAQQDQKVWLILNSTGDVQTLADGE